MNKGGADYALDEKVRNSENTIDNSRNNIGKSLILDRYAVKCG